MRLSMLLLLLLLCGMTEMGTALEDIPTYYMHELCGQSINMRRESIFTARIELLPTAFVFNQTKPEVVNNANGYNTITHCTLNVESWSFQNRLMVHFEEIKLDSHVQCSKPSLEILDGPTESSPIVLGYPDVCELNDSLMARSFVTTDKHMTLSFHDNPKAKRTSIIRAVIVSFNEGPCRSYEHQCFNGRCIMEDIVCNGHNPCGDNSDCPRIIPQQEVATTEDDHVMLAAIVATSSTLIAIVVCAAVLYKCYWTRRKHRRLHLQHHYLAVTNNTRQPTHANSQPTYERTVSQLEADKSFAPPSYSQLPVLQNQSEIEELESAVESEEQFTNEINLDKCLEPNDKHPPSYVCVMLHQDAFNVSETNIHALTANEIVSGVTERTDEGGTNTRVTINT